MKPLCITALGMTTLVVCADAGANGYALFGIGALFLIGLLGVKNS